MNGYFTAEGISRKSNKGRMDSNDPHIPGESNIRDATRQANVNDQTADNATHGTGPTRKSGPRPTSQGGLTSGSSGFFNEEASKSDSVDLGTKQANANNDQTIDNVAHGKGPTRKSGPRSTSQDGRTSGSSGFFKFNGQVNKNDSVDLGNATSSQANNDQTDDTRNVRRGTMPTPGQRSESEGRGTPPNPRQQFDFARKREGNDYKNHGGLGLFPYYLDQDAITSSHFIYLPTNILTPEKPGD